MEREIINVRFEGVGLARKLSNLYPYTFTLDGLTYACMEAFFSCLRTSDEQQKIFMRNKSGHLVYSLGHRFDWKETQQVNYNRKNIDRHSDEYDILITRAFDALFENEDFRNALKGSGNSIFKHTIGKTNKYETLLTRREFTEHLYRLRERLSNMRFKSLFEFD